MSNPVTCGRCGGHDWGCPECGGDGCFEVEWEEEDEDAWRCDKCQQYLDDEGRCPRCEITTTPETHATMDIQRDVIWRVTLKFWPAATTANVTPTETTLSDLLTAEGNPALFYPMDFLFKRLPSKDDFKAMLDSLPWAFHLRERLYPVIDDEQNSWPLVPMTKKRQDYDFFDADGKLVGNIEVSRVDVYTGESYDRLLVEDTIRKPYQVGKKRSTAR